MKGSKIHTLDKSLGPKSTSTPSSTPKTVEKMKLDQPIQKSGSDETLGNYKELEEMSSELMNMFTSFGL